MSLRYDPVRPPQLRSVEVWHRGRRIEIAKRVDVYANCFVKRDRPSFKLQPAQSPSEQPEGLRMRELRDEAIRSPAGHSDRHVQRGKDR